MGLESIPEAVCDKYHIDEQGHASAILASDYPNEFKDIMDCLAGFILTKSHIRVLAVGVMITRMSELQGLFNRLGKGKSYGASTTHWNKLIPKVDGGGAGGCPNNDSVQ
jgi:hypothetical protein